MIIEIISVPSERHQFDFCLLADKTDLFYISFDNQKMIAFLLFSDELFSPPQVLNHLLHSNRWGTSLNFLNFLLHGFCFYVTPTLKFFKFQISNILTADPTDGCLPWKSFPTPDTFVHHKAPAPNNSRILARYRRGILQLTCMARVI